MAGSGKGDDSCDTFDTKEILCVFRQNDRNPFAQHSGGELAVEIVLPGDIANHAEVECLVEAFQREWKHVQPAQARQDSRMGGNCTLPAVHPLCKIPAMEEIMFEVREDEADGGFVATALGHAIATQGDSVEELREMVRDAVRCHFGDGSPGPMPKIIRLHFVRDEALAV